MIYLFICYILVGTAGRTSKKWQLIRQKQFWTQLCYWTEHGVWVIKIKHRDCLWINEQKNRLYKEIWKKPRVECTKLPASKAVPLFNCNFCPEQDKSLNFLSTENFLLSNEHQYDMHNNFMNFHMPCFLQWKCHLFRCPYAI